jgi:hypothetical protein
MKLIFKNRMAVKDERKCTVETKKSKRESIERFFSLINFIFFMSEEEDITLLRYLHEAKAKVLANSERWSLVDSIEMTIGRIFRCIDTIDIEEEWDSKNNKEWFHEMIKSMNTLKELHPQWHLTKQDVDRYSTTCPCSQCSIRRGQRRHNFL